MGKAAGPTKGQKIWVFLFFGLFLCSGLLLFDDYGLSWDERFHVIRGELYLDYFLHRDPAVFQDYIQKYFGPLPEVLMTLITKATGLDQDSRSFVLVILLWFLVPILAIIIPHVPTQDEYRHLFFIYPALLLMSVHGLVTISGFLKKLTWPRFPRAGEAALVGGAKIMAVYLEK